MGRRFERDLYLTDALLKFADRKLPLKNFGLTRVGDDINLAANRIGVGPFVRGDLVLRDKPSPSEIFIRAINNAPLFRGARPHKLSPIFFFEDSNT